MFKESLYTKTEQVLNNLKVVDILSQFYLAGGTALALQLGHRKSVDLDFFTTKFPNVTNLKQSLSSFNIKVLNENDNSLDLEIEGVKVSFLEYKYTLLNDFVDYDRVKLASVEDILCMKLTAISSRGSKKYFIDLYFGLMNGLTLESLFLKFQTKYLGVEYSDKHIIRSLIEFDIADTQPDVDYLKEKIDWNIIKKYFLTISSRFL